MGAVEAGVRRAGRRGVEHVRPARERHLGQRVEQRGLPGAQRLRRRVDAGEERVAVVREHRGVALDDAAQLLRSPWHEARLFALLLLVDAYRRGTADARDAIYRLYLDHTAYVDNWDLVDTSAPYIVGAHLEAGDRRVLERLARSASLWERRIAMLATQHFIRGGEFGTALRIAEMLVDDGHDLIHKAVGWMLREVGNRDRAAEEAFLRRHHRTMPRTMLRYAIEKFPPELRQSYLRGEMAESA